MFFPRLRNQAKWAFVLLIVVFAGGFVFLGVGSGGLDLGQLLRDAFGNKGPSSGSVSKAQEQVREHPRDGAARRNLATVLEKKGRTEEAIDAWSQYTALRPSPTGTFGSALGQDPIASALSSKSSTEFQQASVKYQTAADAAIGTYK